LLLPPQWDGEENWKKKPKLLGWDEDSLTEQQREKKITIILIKRIYRAKFSLHLKVSFVPSGKLSSPGQLPHLNTK